MIISLFIFLAVLFLCGVGFYGGWLWRDKKYHDSHIIWGSTLAYKPRTPAWSAHAELSLRDKIKRLTEKLTYFEASVKEDRDRLSFLDMEVVIKESQIVELENRLRESEDRYLLASRVLEARKKAVENLEVKLHARNEPSRDAELFHGEVLLSADEFSGDTSNFAQFTDFVEFEHAAEVRVENVAESMFEDSFDESFIFSEIAALVDNIPNEVSDKNVECEFLPEAEVAVSLITDYQDTKAALTGNSEIVSTTEIMTKNLRNFIENQKPRFESSIIARRTFENRLDTTTVVAAATDNSKQSRRQNKKSIKRQQVSTQTRTILENAVEKAIMNSKQSRKKPVSLVSAE